MNCEVFIKPRQSGKTTTIIDEFLKDPNNSCIIAPNDSMALHIKDKIDGFPNVQARQNIFSANNFIIKTRGKRYQIIYLDEYLFWNPVNSSEINSNFKFFLAENGSIKIYSTSSKLYNRKIFNSVQKIREEGGNIYEFSNSLMHPFFKNEAIDLYDNLITLPGTKINAIDFPKGLEVDFENKNKNIIFNREEFLMKLNENGMASVCVNFKISDEILEEFFEDINWVYYLIFNELSSEFKQKFSKAVNFFNNPKRYSEFSKQIDRFRKVSQNKEETFLKEVIGKLFII